MRKRLEKRGLTREFKFIDTLLCSKNLFIKSFILCFGCFLIKKCDFDVEMVTDLARASIYI